MRPVSVIMPAYKVVDYIEESLNSIEAQDYPGIYEIIVGVDGCVPTLEKLISIKSKYSKMKVYFLEPNKGLFVTLNTLITLANYQNIIKFDSDDIMCPNLLSEVMRYDEDIVRFQYYPIEYSNNCKKWKKPIHHYSSGCFKFNKKSIKLLGGFENYKCSADGEFCRRLDQHTEITKRFIDKGLYYYRSKRPGSISVTVPNKKRAEYHKVYKNKTYKNFYIVPELHLSIKKIIGSQI